SGKSASRSSHHAVFCRSRQCWGEISSTITTEVEGLLRRPERVEGRGPLAVGGGGFSIAGGCPLLGPTGIGFGNFRTERPDRFEVGDRLVELAQRRVGLRPQPAGLLEGAFVLR